MNDENKYWGKYRGTVLNNVDPERRGRLMLVVPDVLTLLPTTWAEPCVPLAGPTVRPWVSICFRPRRRRLVGVRAGDPDYRSGGLPRARIAIRWWRNVNPAIRT